MLAIAPIDLFEVLSDDGGVVTSERNAVPFIILKPIIFPVKNNEEPK